MNDLFNRFSECGEVKEDVSFTTLTTYKAGGTARFVVYPRNVFSLQSIISICKENGLPFKVFGNGSNILCSDDVFEGVIIRLNRTMNQFSYDGNVLTARAGCSIISLAYESARNSLSGLEFASGIPGSLGGCLFMNAGAYKSSMSDMITEVQVLIDDQIVWLSNRQCEFGYRTSVFQKHPEWIILAARIQLVPADRDTITNLMKTRQQRRFETQPLEMPSAGSVFRNPEGDFAWKYIDMIGYRGHCIGDACVSEKHSNFIVNKGHATGSEIAKLIEEIQKKVKEQFGIELVLEVEKFNWTK